MTGTIRQLSDVADQREIDDTADVVVIGSGAGGATAARVLSAAGLDVVIIEEGHHVPTEKLRSDAYTSFKYLWRDMGFQVAQGRAFTPILQGCCVGGTTAVNGAIMHRIPRSIYDGWVEEHGIGRGVEWEQLLATFETLDSELHVGTAPDEIFGENNRLMEKGVQAIGAEGHRIRRNVKDCQGSAHCNQGCPTAARQSMNNSFVPRALENGARVYATCSAERILREHGRASGVVARFRDPVSKAKGPRLRVRAKKAVVVAASAIQTPLLLQQNGIGRASRMVGERLMCHPGTGVVGVFDKPVKIYFGATQGYETTHFWQEKMKFETVAMPLEFAAARLPGIGMELKRELGLFDHIAIWGVQIRAEAQGRVRRNFLGAPVIEYDLLDSDIERLKLGVQRLVRMMFAAGAREVLPGVHGIPDRIHAAEEIDRIFSLPNDPRLFHCIAAHLFGTAKLGLSPSNSVVTPELEAHDLPGLYVMDASVFPTNMGVNPQHPICAMSWIASERLAQRC